MDSIHALESLVPDLEKGLSQASGLEDLETLRITFLGRKGRLAEIMSSLGRLAPEKRPEAGKKANEVKERLTGLFERRKAELEEAEARKKDARFDPTVPGRAPWLGTLHPITLIMEEAVAVLERLGYDVVTGPEVETEYYNFEALNMPKDHPARDMQDTLYLSSSVLLRTHTSPMQVRTMLSRRPPLAVIAPGKVYRRDSDLTHTPMFHQIEGLLVDHNITFADLRGTLTAFVRQIFGPETRVRFRPSFFPFTEPSAEVDISCVICKGRGEVDGQPCRVCKQTGWVEILGCGAVDPNVFEAVGIDPEEWTGFAFGMGMERIAMLKYGANDLRMFFENDVRFLRQFR